MTDALSRFCATCGTWYPSTTAPCPRCGNPEFAIGETAKELEQILRSMSEPRIVRTPVTERLDMIEAIPRALRPRL